MTYVCPKCKHKFGKKEMKQVSFFDEEVKEWFRSSFCPQCDVLLMSFEIKVEK